MNNNNEKYLFEWEEWKMESADGISSIEVPGRPVSVSAAFTGKYWKNSFPFPESKEIFVKSKFSILKLTKNEQVKKKRTNLVQKITFSQFEMLQKMDFPSFEIDKNG